MFPEPTELRLIGCSIESIWTQNPIQIHRHQKPTRRHSNQRKFHTWWVESFVVLVQYQPFQFYSVLWYTGETISTRFRRRTSHSKIATDDESYCQDAVARIVLDFSNPGEEKLRKSRSLEFNCQERRENGATWWRHRFIRSLRSSLQWAIYGKLLFSKLFKMGWRPRLVFSRVENWDWDVRAIGATWYNFLENDSKSSTWSRGNSSRRNRAIRQERGNASWQIGATWYRFSRKGLASTIRHWKRRSRIGIVCRIKIIRESGAWSRAKNNWK